MTHQLGQTARNTRWGALLVAGAAVAALAACTGEAGGTSSSGPDGAGASAAASSTATATSTGSATPQPSEVPSAATAPPSIASDDPGRQDSVLVALPGSTTKGCVTVGKDRDVRSGTMAGGNFAAARSNFAAAPSEEVPFYFIPAAVSEDAELEVTVSRPDGSSATTVRTSGLQQADVWSYYVTRVKIPGEGTWRLTATDGTSRGCWEADFTR